MLKNINQIKLFYVLSFLILTIGVIFGAVYFSMNFSFSEEIRTHLENYLIEIKSGMSFEKVLKSAIKSYAVIYIAVLAASFFKAGPVVSFFVLIRNGFVQSFTLASMYNFYGTKGLIFSLNLVPKIVIAIPTMAIFSGISMLFSRKKDCFEKKEKIFYIFFSLTVITIFCISAVFESLLTTIFMKWISMKVT